MHDTNSASHNPAAEPEEPNVAAGGLANLATTYVKGVVMGMADMIPGVSGGTVAIILGVYGGVLESLGSLTRPEFLRALLRGRLVAAFRAMNGALLFPLVAGIATSLIVLSRLIGYLLSTYPNHVLAFFFGLVAASAIVVGRHVKRWGPVAWLALVSGAFLGVLVVTRTPVETPDGAAFLFFAGFVAICAMVLPGISGAFVLVLLGKYDFALAGLARFDFGVIVPIGLGAVVGLLSFARLLAFLLRRWHDPMLALLTGFMVGSLYKVWPYVTEAGAATWPWATGSAGIALLLTGLLVFGALLVLGLERLSAGRSGLSVASRSSFSSTAKFTGRR